MTSSYLAPGDVLTLTAPTGGVTAGTPVLIGGILVIPKTTAAQTVAFDAYVTGVHSGTKTASQAWAEGQAVYWNTATSRFDSVGSTGPLVGVAAEAVGSGAGETTGKVRLGAVPYVGAGVFHIRKRFTTAEVNAGATLLAAVAGVKYRMLDAAAIAIGGNAAVGTTADILGTTTTEKKLVAFATAQLTQNALLRAGATGAAILADGASFVAQDANSVIRVLKTGSDFTTMTHLDVLFTYAMDPA